MWAAGLIYLFFTPYIIFFPWLILIEDKNTFDSFRESYHLVKDRWFKYAALFFVSFFIILCAVACLLGAALVFIYWFNGVEIADFYRLNQSLGATVPLNVKSAVLIGLISGYGLRFQISLMLFVLFFLYVSVFGLNTLILVLAAGYKTIKDYNLVAAEEKRASAKEDVFEITEFFKNTKEITIDSGEPEEFDESAIGPQTRTETLRQFHKEEYDTIPPYAKQKPPMHEYPDPDSTQE